MKGGTITENFINAAIKPSGLIIKIAVTAIFTIDHCNIEFISFVLFTERAL